MMDLEKHFAPFLAQTIGVNQYFTTPYGEKRIIYADWMASGRLYGPIEEIMSGSFGPFLGNTHTETSVTGSMMTTAFHKALGMIKDHVNASESDYIIACESGMTGVINKFQRMLGFKIHENFQDRISIEEEDRPVVFITHMEHHSNQTSWLETIVTLEIIKENADGLPDLGDLKRLLDKYKHRKLKIASITACSNVTGVVTPYYDISKMMHQHGGTCFVDFACSAPYVDIDMHPECDELSRLDAVFLSPHKFLGGPGTPGILVFNKDLYSAKVPDTPGGGTVSWTNPWGEHKYFEDVETRESGGTPPFMQTIKAALAIKLKNSMGVINMQKREEEILDIIFKGIKNLPNLHILADNLLHRLGAISFYIDDLHFNLGVKLLNDRFGIQMRGGCSCAGTYGHILLNITQDVSQKITNQIDNGVFESKPGWIRCSIHPTMTNHEVEFIVESLIALTQNHHQWAEDYVYETKSNEYTHVNEGSFITDRVDAVYAQI